MRLCDYFADTIILTATKNANNAEIILPEGCRRIVAFFKGSEGIAAVSINHNSYVIYIN